MAAPTGNLHIVSSWLLTRREICTVQRLSAAAMAAIMARGVPSSSSFVNVPDGARRLCTHSAWSIVASMDTTLTTALPMPERLEERLTTASLRYTARHIQEVRTEAGLYLPCRRTANTNGRKRCSIPFAGERTVRMVRDRRHHYSSIVPAISMERP